MNRVLMNSILLAMSTGVLQTPLHAQFPIITNQPSSQAVWAGGSVNFTVGLKESGPISYQWQKDGTNLPNDIITTVAGNGTSVFAGDGGPATNASLYYPQGVAFDAAGNLFITDNNNARVREVDTNGIITTVAGNRPQTYSGDGGAATNASLNHPNNLAFDAAGNTYIADIFNNRIRKVNTNGVITTVAGNGISGFHGDGGMATNAEFNDPACVALDTRGNMFIADLFNSRIREVDTNGIITTVAGGSNVSGDGGLATNASLSISQGVAVDATGNFYIADTGNHSIRKVDTNGIITTIVGGGRDILANGIMATNAQLYKPWGVTLDTVGNIYFADEGYHRVSKVDTNGIITTVAGKVGHSGYTGDGGAATNANLNGPACVALDKLGNLYIADWYNNRIREVHFSGFPTLTLSNVNASNAGNYQVIVKDASGTIISSVVSLIVASSPIIYHSTRDTDGQITLACVSKPNSTNVMLCATNLSSPVSWQPVLTNVAAANGDWQFTDTNTSEFTTRFYRSVTQ